MDWNWLLKVLIIITLNLLNIIWIGQIKLKRTINRSRRWKRILSILYFIMSPLMLLAFLLDTPYLPFITAFMALFGFWFSLTQFSFQKKHSGVPQLVTPLTSFYFIGSGLLLGFSLINML